MYQQLQIPYRHRVGKLTKQNCESHLRVMYGEDAKPGGPSKSTARGLLDSNFRRVLRAISSYTLGLRRDNNMVSSISLQIQEKVCSNV